MCRCVCCTLFSRLDSSFLLCDILKPVGFHIEEIHGLCCAFFYSPSFLFSGANLYHITMYGVKCPSRRVTVQKNGQHNAARFNSISYLSSCDSVIRSRLISYLESREFCKGASFTYLFTSAVLFSTA